MEQKGILGLVYTFFLGLMLAIFVGVGISAFYPAPKMPEYPASGMSFAKEPTPAEIDAQKDFDRKMRQHNEDTKIYSRNVSIISLGVAVLLVAVSIVFAEKLRVLADGIMLGGLFTLVYSIGRSFASENNKYVFVVASVGLAVVLYLGYHRLVRTASTPKKSKRRK